MEMTSEQKLSIYGDYLNEFKDEDVYRIVKEVIEHTPTIFFGASTSSTGKYHPQATNGLMGLVKHAVAVMLTAKEFLTNDTVLNIFGMMNLNDLDKEIILAACLIHDNAKYGADEIEDKTVKYYTQSQHPRLVRNIIQKTTLYELDEAGKEKLRKIVKLIETHMGQWTFVREGEPLEKPSTRAQAFVHMCDFVASRKTFDTVSEMTFPEGIDNEIMESFKTQL